MPMAAERKPAGRLLQVPLRPQLRRPPRAAVDQTTLTPVTSAAAAPSNRMLIGDQLERLRPGHKRSINWGGDMQLLKHACRGGFRRDRDPYRTTAVCMACVNVLPSSREPSSAVTCSCRFGLWPTSPRQCSQPSSAWIPQLATQ